MEKRLHYTAQPKQDARIKALYDEGLGAVRIQRQLVKEFRDQAFSHITVARRVTAYRKELAKKASR